MYIKSSNLSHHCPHIFVGNVRFSTGSDLFILQARISVAIGVNYGLKLEREQLRLQYTFGSAIFFKFGFLGQNSGRRIISNFRNIFLKKAKYWRRNGGFTFSPEVKVYPLIDSPMARMQSTETIFAGITYMDVTN